MNVAERLAPIELLDPDNNTVRLGSTWSARAVVLVFIRHFG